MTRFGIAAAALAALALGGCTVEQPQPAAPTTTSTQPTTEASAEVTTSAAPEFVSLIDAQGAAAQVPAAIAAKWEALGGAEGELGAPVSVVDKNGQEFVVTFSDGTSLAYSALTGVWPLKGMIGATWFEQGGLGNPIGLPIAAEHTTERGFVQEFNGGRIFWEARDTPEFAAYVERN